MIYNPLVTIIIPVYNGSNYMKEAINSALNQTYEKIEIIVVNDGSSDEGKTHEIALSYGDKIKYFSKSNGGVSSALNLGINNMKGDWFSWLSHDDIYYSNKIKCQIEYLNKMILNQKIINPTDVVLYSAWELMDKTGKTFFKGNVNSAIFKNKKDWLLKNIKNNYLGGCSFLVPKSAFELAGKFNEKIRTMSDYDMWYRLALMDYQMVYIPKILVRGRVHSQQVTYTYSGNDEIEQFHINLIEKLANIPEYNLLDVMLKLGYFTRRRRLIATSNIAFEKALEIDHSFTIRVVIIIVKLISVLYYYSKRVIKKMYLKLRIVS